MIILLVIIAALLSATLMVLAVGTIFYMKRFDKAVGEMEKTLSAFRKDVLPLAVDLKRLWVDADELVIAARRQCDRMMRVTEAAENLLDGKTLTRVAGDAVSSSKVTLISVIEGIKQGFKTLRSSRTESKEEPQDE
ncbi:MAG: hypothetical protein NT018_12855 [Armatimonadetes bacterium]|nr:hypothetical protein [Armatimonadota bacterium]